MRSIFGRKATAAAKVEQREIVSEDKAATAAQVEVFKTTLALTAANAENPNSAPLTVASRTANNAFALLQQRSPLALGIQSEAREIVDGLLSAEVSRRISAESKQALAEKSNARLSAELSELRSALDGARKAAASEAARNLELANEYRWEQLQKWGGVALSALLSVALIAYRLNIGRLQTGAAEVLASIGARHGTAAESTARSALDAVLHTAEQQAVARAYLRIIGTGTQESK